MKYSLLLLSLATIITASCHEPKQSTKTDMPGQVENKIMIPSSTCYASITGKDTVKLKVEVFPNVVTGKLSYNLYQKDSNQGDFNGRVHGDTLLADYTFMSEGKSSARQVIFLIKEGIAVEGYGNMEEKDGTMVFKNIKEISFEKGLTLKKVVCGEY